MTSLVGVKRTKKNDVRLIAYGSVDELNSFLGLLRSKVLDESVSEQILEIQNMLFFVGAHLATDQSSTALTSSSQVESSKIKQLETWLDVMDSELPALKNFIIYGDDELSALCHVCRAVCRRSERAVLDVLETDKVGEEVLEYMNRLSDYLFVLARYVGKNAVKEDFFWKK